MDETSFLQQENISFSTGLTLFSGREIQEEYFLQTGENILHDGKTVIKLAAKNSSVKKGEKKEHHISFCVQESAVKEGRFFFDVLLPSYNENWFVFIPSSCYAGNDFTMVKEHCYPPKYFKEFTPADPLHPEIAMWQIPSVGRGKLFNRSVTDGSTPLVGVFMPERKQAFFLTFEQGTSLGNNGIEISVTEENSLRILLSLPCVRRESFIACQNLDDAPELAKGLTLSASIQSLLLPTEDLADFYRIFSEIRSSFFQQSPYKNTRSFSHASEILLKMFEEVRYLKNYGFFTKTRGLETLNTGWTAYPESIPLYKFGNDTLKKYVLTQLENIFKNAIAPSGFLWSTAIVTEGKVEYMADNFPIKTEKGCCITRLPAEFLFYTLKMFLLLDEEKVSYPEEWKKLAKNLADAFIRLYERYGQIGCIINVPDGEMVLGGSFSGAILPAALLLASDCYGEEKYFSTGEKILVSYLEELKKKGFTYGGPGDCMFAPDSESASALLLSTVLYSHRYSGKKYLPEAEFCADYFASWVPSVKYTFPAGTTLALMDADCRGAVQANLQNQHGAPAPCTDSANSLFLLYRLSGKEKYLRLLQEIIHNCVQYISTENHPIPMLKGGFVPVGDICEKVFFQDYVNRCGIIPYGSGGWTECAVLMCITENPGIYCDLQKDLLIVFDHVEAQLHNKVLTVKNPFSYPVKVSLYVEKTGKKTSNVSPLLSFLSCEEILLKAFETISIFPEE
ncbi:MAG: hypothetical protein J6S53_01460 [Lentisphaeria bacterium]|nr:hypothetical protein [Lentisphaeria bacterium]